jgi:hypothetical protein
VSFTIPQVTFLLSNFHIGSFTTGRASRQPPSVRVTSYLPCILAISHSTRFVFLTPLTRLAPFTQATSYSGFYTSYISNHVVEWRLLSFTVHFGKLCYGSSHRWESFTKMSKRTTVFAIILPWLFSNAPSIAPPNANGNQSMSHLFSCRKHPSIASQLMLSLIVHHHRTLYPMLKFLFK